MAAVPHIPSQSNSSTSPQVDPKAVALACDAAAALNNADVSADYVLKLKREMEESTDEVFSGGQDREKLRSIVADLLEASTAFRYDV